VNAPSLALLAAAAAVLALATWAHYAFWTWRYAVPTGEDEVVRAETADGWSLALARRRPRGPRRGPPVLLVHGVAANHAGLDFPLQRWSLAAHLQAAGFECFALDLRGHGYARRARRDAPRRWNFDDHLRLDVPAALAAVRGATGARAVLWVGHSQGGLLGMAACQLYPDAVAGLVAMGSPAFFGAQDPLKLFGRFGFLVTGRLNKFLARVVAPWSGFWHPPVSQIAINGRNVTRPVYRRILVNVVENISSGVLRQYARWIATDTFSAQDGAHDYRAGLGGCAQPALFLAAASDLLAPPMVVARAAEAWGGEARYLVVGTAGDRLAYGHSDLLFGKRAPEEVFPRVAEWLVEHSRAAGEEVRA
jgi:pimeloyl-ACP methyl ester carboxylesterase